MTSAVYLKLTQYCISTIFKLKKIIEGPDNFIFHHRVLSPQLSKCSEISS